MGTRVGRRAAVAGLAVLAAGAGACGGDTAAVTATGLEVLRVEVDGGGHGFDLGRSTAPALVPLLVRADDRVAVHVIDAAEGTARPLGAPTERPVAGTRVVLAGSWAVVSATECGGPVVDTDTGPECDGDPRPVVLATPVEGAPAWAEVDLGDALADQVTAPWIGEVAEDRVVLRLAPTGDGQGPHRQVEVDLADGTSAEVTAYDPGAPRCSQGDERDLTFPTPDGPTSAVRPGSSAAVPLPDAVSPLPDLFCWSSGSWLLSGTTLVDLDHPDAAAVEIDGEASVEGEVQWFGAAGDAWAADLGPEIVVRPGPGAERVSVDVPPDHHSQVVAHGLAVAVYDDDGLASVWAVPFR